MWVVGAHGSNDLAELFDNIYLAIRGQVEIKGLKATPYFRTGTRGLGGTSFLPICRRFDQFLDVFPLA